VIANLAVRLSNRSRKAVNKISLPQIDFAPLHERVYAEVREAVIAGKFAPGQELTSRKLAAALGTSDMPVRAAISRLTAEGGLVRMANSTFVVPVLGRQQFKEVMELRALLESRAASLACGGIDREGFKRLQRHSKDLDEASKREDIVGLKFTIYGYCESPTLTALIEMLWLRVGPALRFHLTVLKRITRISYHHQAIKALEQKRAKAAAEWISRDILEGMQSLLSVARFADDKTEAPAKK
jgi:DNA-binding GntR family transcriptional regulator